jgi:hypothetical protein
VRERERERERERKRERAHAHTHASLYVGKSGRKRRASSVAMFQIEILDFIPERRAAWLF